MPEPRPPLRPFTTETAAQKVRMAEDAWNTRDPARVALAYTTDSRWRNRAEFLQRPFGKRRPSRPDATAALRGKVSSVAKQSKRS
jgi:nuclear transport factor 2 (NTF2) superfamily protein